MAGHGRTSRQYETDTGPCPEAMRTGTVVRVEHMAAGVVTAFEEGLADRPERW